MEVMVWVKPVLDLMPSSGIIESESLRIYLIFTMFMIGAGWLALGRSSKYRSVTRPCSFGSMNRCGIESTYKESMFTNPCR
jgi:hypothetical protein